MVLFCILWMPLCYYFWRSLRSKDLYSGDIWALLTGCLAAVLRFLVPVFVNSGSFGFLRWISAFVDYAALPVIFPLAAAFVLSKIKLTRGFNDICGFILVALIPVVLVRSIFWSAQNDPLRLVLPPVLWASIAFCLYPAVNISIYKKIPLHFQVLCVAALAFLLASTSWWGFFCQKVLLGYVFLLPLLVGMAATAFFMFKKKVKS